MTEGELIAQQGRRIKILEAEADVYRTRIENLRGEIEYLHEYLRCLKNNLNKHMSNPKLYPKYRFSKDEH